MLASVEDVKRYIGKQGKEEDALLDLILSGVSARLQEAIGQPMYPVQYTEVIQRPPYPYSTIVTAHGPIGEINSIADNGVALASDDDGNLVTDDWRVDDGRVIKRMQDGKPGLWSGQIDIVYRTAATPADVRLAAVMQTALEYRNSKPGGDRLGLDSTSGDVGESVSYVELAWLPIVEATIKRRRSF